MDVKARVNVEFFIDDDSESRIISSVNIPLGDNTFNIKVNDLVNSRGSIKNSPTWDTYKSICCFVGTLLSVICLVLVVRLTKFVTLSFKKKNKYMEELDGILKNYDHDIINSTGNSLKDKEVIKVESFKELLEVHENLGEPIIYNKINDVKVEFIVNDGDKIYKYVMKEADF